MSKSDRIFWPVLSAMFVLGFVGGYRMSGLPGLDTHKLLNLAGLLYAFLGVLVLSEVLATERWKSLSVKWLAPTILWLPSVIPLGAFFSGFAGETMKRPSSATVGTFSLAFLGYSMIPVSLFNEIVVFPQLQLIKRDVETRWRWLGFFLVLSGVGVQLIAAVIDLR
jgi:hypothetical protein